LVEKFGNYNTEESFKQFKSGKNGAEAYGEYLKAKG
jgi:hypothetical protein